MQYNLDYLSRLDSLNNVDSLLVAILSHGSEEVIYGVDGVPIAMFDLFQPFTSEKCPSLHHKPKFFIINACRGGNYLDLVARKPILWVTDYVQHKPHS